MGILVDGFSEGFAPMVADNWKGSFVAFEGKDWRDEDAEVGVEVDASG